MNKRIKQYRQTVKRLLHTRRGHNAMVYAIFIVIATIFWFMMSLNDEVQRDYRIPVTITDIPSDITLLSDETPIINASVKDRGRHLIKYDWGGDPRLEVRFSDFTITEDNRMILSEQTVKSLVRDLFSQSTQLAYLNPDSISLKFTSQPGVNMPVYAALDIQASPQHIIHGNIKVSPDTVTLFAPKGIPSDITSLSTTRIAARGLADTTTYILAIDVPAGMRVKPDKVEVSVPVEPLISKTVKVEINPVNVPRGKTLLLFPSMVNVTMLIPMSEYNRPTQNQITVNVDYNEIKSSESVIPVTPTKVSDYIKSATCVPDQVEYIVQQEYIPILNSQSDNSTR